MWFILIAAQLLRIIPSRVRRLLEKLLHKSLTLKRISALRSQIVWCREFEANKDKVLEYWRRYRYLDLIMEVCRINEKSRILDVGCGISTVLHYVRGEKYGIDPLADAYKKIYRYPSDMTILRGVGENIPFPDEFFDAVFCSNALDHVEDPKKTVEEIHRVLKKGGYFILTVEIFKRRGKRDIKHPYSFTQTDIHLLVKDKFKIIFERESPWIGLRSYVRGREPSVEREELILISQRI